MDIRELNYFYQVAKNKNFTLAAKKLHISQPALSKTIKKLEQELDADLFTRTPNEVQLTENGLNLLEKTEEILYLYENIQHSFYQENKVYAGKIRVGIPPVIGSSIFVSILTSFRNEYPNIEVDIIENGAKVLEHNLQNGTIDLGVVISPVEESKFDFLPIYKDQNVIVLHQDHRLSSREELSFADLEHDTFLILNKTFMLHHHIIEKCLESGYKPSIYFESSQWDFLLELVAQNQGITILPRPILKHVEKKSVMVLPFKEPFPWQVGFLTQKDQHMSYAVKTFIHHTLRLYEKRRS